MSYQSILQAINSVQPIEGLTHNYYLHPARFSPVFARAVISALTKPGDVVLDPFMGGGTTVVEALISGRNVIGVDLNPLSVFVTKVKTTPLSNAKLKLINMWKREVADLINLHDKVSQDRKWVPYQKYVPWPIRKGVDLFLEYLKYIEDKHCQDFVRCGLLKTAQWALDCKRVIPSFGEFKKKFENNIDDMCARMDELKASLRGTRPLHKVLPARRLLMRSVVGIEEEKRFPHSWEPPRLVLTSPPYPGVHVLYHRWQIGGRLETSAPYWIINRLDGNFESFYTLGHRQQQNLEKYYIQLRKCFESIRRIVSQDTILVQLVSFSNPEWQLPRYLDVMSECGFKEVKLGVTNRLERIWRKIPNRRWYADLKGRLASSSELLLCHRPSINKSHSLT